MLANNWRGQLLEQLAWPAIGTTGVASYRNNWKGQLLKTGVASYWNSWLGQLWNNWPGQLIEQLAGPVFAIAEPAIGNWLSQL